MIGLIGVPLFKTTASVMLIVIKLTSVFPLFYHSSSIKLHTCYTGKPGYQFTEVTLNTCVQACTIRDNCAGVSYNRRYTLCGLYDYNSSLNTTCKGMVTLKKMDADTTKPTECKIHACPPLSRCNDSSRMCETLGKTIGSSCNTATDCNELNSRCAEGICMCILLHEYNHDWQVCEQVCLAYSETYFRKHSETRVFAFSIIRLDVPLEDCKKECVSQVNINNCVGFDYYHKSDMCFLQFVTKQQVIDSKPEYVISSSVSDYFERECIRV